MLIFLLVSAVNEAALTREIKYVNMGWGRRGEYREIFTYPYVLSDRKSAKSPYVRKETIFQLERQPY